MVVRPEVIRRPMDCEATEGLKSVAAPWFMYLEPDVSGTIWAHYYGRIGLGRIQGPAMTISVCASAIGPLPLAVFHSLTGTYTLGIMVMMVLPVLSVAVLFFARPGGTSPSERLKPNVRQPS